MRTWFTSLAVVLACAAAGFVVRSAVQDDPAAAGRLPVTGPAANGPVAFDRSAATSRKVPRDGSLLARADGRSIATWWKPSTRRTSFRGRLTERKLFGRRLPLVFLVSERRKGWARVRLAGRPNGRSAWVRRKDITYAVTRMRLRVRVADRRLDVFQGRRRLRTIKIGVGRSVSPTPRGRHYVTDLVKAKDPDGFYGPYALGLSAYSPVITDFAGGDGQIGIHGTDAPEALGTSVSAGCIRVANREVRRLAKQLPLGTPVDIR